MFDSARANIIGPLSSGVLKFVCGYCIGVFILLLLQAFKWNGFNLPENIFYWVIGVAGVSVIGLVGTLIISLFKK